MNRTFRTSSGAIPGAKWPGLLARSQSVRCRTSSTAARLPISATTALPSPRVQPKPETRSQRCSPSCLFPRWDARLQAPGRSCLLHLAAPVTSPRPVRRQKRLQTLGRPGSRVPATVARVSTSPAHLVRHALGFVVPERICAGLIRVIRIPDVDEQELGDPLVLAKQAEGSSRRRLHMDRQATNWRTPLRSW